MKKTILFSFALIIGLVTQTNAQSEDYKINLGASINATGTGALFKAFINILEFENVEITRQSTPSFQGTIDYSLHKNFSLGLAGSYQTIGFDAKNSQFTDSDGLTQVEDYNLTVSRTSVALRPLFHYGNSERWDLYSGLRLQYFILGISTDSKDLELVQEFTDETGISSIGLLSVGVTAFGARCYVTNNIGIGTEINIGRPYFFNLSVNARF